MNCPSCNLTLTDSICPCGWSDGSSPIPSRDTYREVEPGISKEQFGPQLYETIKIIGGLLGLEQQRAAAIHYEKGRDVKLLLKRRKDFQLELAKQLPTLTDHEMDQILDRYPWVVRC